MFVHGCCQLGSAVQLTAFAKTPPGRPQREKPAWTSSSMYRASMRTPCPPALSPKRMMFCRQPSSAWPYLRLEAQLVDDELQAGNHVEQRRRKAAGIVEALAVVRRKEAHAGAHDVLRRHGEAQGMADLVPAPDDVEDTELALGRLVPGLATLGRDSEEGRLNRLDALHPRRQAGARQPRLLGDGRDHADRVLDRVARCCRLGDYSGLGVVGHHEAQRTALILEEAEGAEDEVPPQRVRWAAEEVVDRVDGEREEGAEQYRREGDKLHETPYDGGRLARERPRKGGHHKCGENDRGEARRRDEIR